MEDKSDKTLIVITVIGILLLAFGFFKNNGSDVIAEPVQIMSVDEKEVELKQECIDKLYYHLYQHSPTVAVKIIDDYTEKLKEYKLKSEQQRYPMSRK